MANCWHPDQNATHPHLSYSDSIRIWEVYKQAVKTYPRHATIGYVEHTAVPTPENLAGPQAISIYQAIEDSKITFYNASQDFYIPHCTCAMGLSSLLLHPHVFSWLGLAPNPAKRHRTCPPCPILTLGTAFRSTRFTYTARLPPLWHPLWRLPNTSYPNPLDKIVAWFMAPQGLTRSFCSLADHVARRWIQASCKIQNSVWVFQN
jgi:hypothetical protein